MAGFLRRGRRKVQQKIYGSPGSEYHHRVIRWWHGNNCSVWNIKTTSTAYARPSEKVKSAMVVAQVLIQKSPHLDLWYVFFDGVHHEKTRLPVAMWKVWILCPTT